MKWNNSYAVHMLLMSEDWDKLTSNLQKATKFTNQTLHK